MLSFSVKPQLFILGCRSFWLFRFLSFIKVILIAWVLTSWMLFIAGFIFARAKENIAGHCWCPRSKWALDQSWEWCRCCCCATSWIWEIFDISIDTEARKGKGFQNYWSFLGMDNLKFFFQFFFYQILFIPSIFCIGN